MDFENKVFLGLGTNLGEKLENLKKALFLLEKSKITILKKSSIYETEPIEMASKNFFFNIVILIQTILSPFELLKIITKIEIDFGRIEKLDENYYLHKKSNLDRIIDIDILDYKKVFSQDKKLFLPHPKISQRLFVLLPLYEIEPTWLHPITKKSITSLVSGIKDQKIKKLDIKI